MMETKRWWNFPKMLSALPLWKDSGTKESLGNAEQLTDLEDDEDMQEFIQKQRNARIFIDEENSEIETQAGGCSKNIRHSRSTSNKSGNLRETDVKKLNNDNLAEIQDVIYEVSNKVSPICFSFFESADIKNAECENNNTYANTQISKFTTNNNDANCDNSFHAKCSDNSTPEKKYDVYNGFNNSGKEKRHVTSMTIVLSKVDTNVCEGGETKNKLDKTLTNKSTNISTICTESQNDFSAIFERNIALDSPKDISSDSVQNSAQKMRPKELSLKSVQNISFESPKDPSPKDPSPKDLSPKDLSPKDLSPKSVGSLLETPKDSGSKFPEDSATKPVQTPVYSSKHLLPEFSENPTWESRLNTSVENVIQDSPTSLSSKYEQHPLEVSVSYNINENIERTNERTKNGNNFVREQTPRFSGPDENCSQKIIDNVDSSCHTKNDPKMESTDTEKPVVEYFFRNPSVVPKITITSPSCPDLLDDGYEAPKCIRGLTRGQSSESALIPRDNPDSDTDADYVDLDSVLDSTDQEKKRAREVARMKTCLRKMSLKRKYKVRKTSVNKNMNKAWRSIKEWWTAEKEKIGSAVLTSKRDLNPDADENSCRKSVFYDNFHENNNPAIEAGCSRENIDCDVENTTGASTQNQLPPNSDNIERPKKNDFFGGTLRFRKKKSYAVARRSRSCYLEGTLGRNQATIAPPPFGANTFRKSRFVLQGQDGFEELRRYIKQGGDFCKELSVVLQERSEAELQYAKTLSKLSSKLIKISKDSTSTVSQAWNKAGIEMEATSEIHKTFAASLCEDVVKPLKSLIDSQHRIRKSVEIAADKTGKNLSDWRAAENKSKKQSFATSRENEKLQDVTLDLRLNSNLNGTTKLTASTIHLQHQKPTSDKEISKLELKRKRSEEAVRKADMEYYTYCIRAERARLEWETAVVRGSQCFQVLEEERLQRLKKLGNRYCQLCSEMAPKLIQSCCRLREPMDNCDVASDIKEIVNQRGVEQPLSEQILPDFYAEHMTLAMNRDRRRQALFKILKLIMQDLERERRGKNGVENLAIAIKQTPTFGTDDSQQNVSEKLHHMRFMLTYLEAARYKISCSLAELDGNAKPSHPLAEHIHVIRDRQGFQQSILKVPLWVYKDFADNSETRSSPVWTDRGSADGNSLQLESDFDEFSSQSGSSDRDFDSNSLFTISQSSPSTSSPGGQCKALYHYSANLYDELTLQPGDVINIHDKQPDGWWCGELNGVIGIFPATYVEEII